MLNEIEKMRAAREDARDDLLEAIAYEMWNRGCSTDLDARVKSLGRARTNLRDAIARDEQERRRCDTGTR